MHFLASLCSYLQQINSPSSGCNSRNGEVGLFICHFHGTRGRTEVVLLLLFVWMEKISAAKFSHVFLRRATRTTIITTIKLLPFRPKSSRHVVFMGNPVTERSCACCS